MSDTQISDGKVAQIHFTLTLEDGEVADSTQGQEPLQYLHGHHNIVPGLERQLVGKSMGDKLQVEVEPADGFGEHDDAGLQEISRGEFPDDLEFEIGMDFGFEDEDGSVQPGWVIGRSCILGSPFGGTP